MISSKAGAKKAQNEYVTFLFLWGFVVFFYQNAKKYSKNYGNMTNEHRR